MFERSHRYRCIITQVFKYSLQRHRFGESTLFAAALALPMGMVRAEPPDCGLAGVNLAYTEARDYASACEAIRETREYFRRIGISTQFKLSVRFAARGEALGGLSESSYAYADRATSRIVVFLSPDARPWGLLWTEALEHSFLRHELVHVAVWHFLGERAKILPREWDEFIAYAVQLELMHPGLRDQVLAKFASVRAFDGAAEVNEFLYGMDPEAFAVAAYRTYRKGGGSKFVLELLTRAAQGWEKPPSLPQ